MAIKHGQIFAGYQLEGYDFKTTFHQDFSIADWFGTSAVRDTYKRAMDEWKTNYEYLTELAIVLNQRCWFYYDDQPDEKLSRLYSDLYYRCRDYAISHLKGDELNYFWQTTD